MYSLLAWLAIGTILLGVVGTMRPGLLDFGWEGILLGLLLLLLTLVFFAHVHTLHCPIAELPEASVAFAPAFEPQDALAQLPGPGNQELANWLAANAKRFSCILTQEAIIWALQHQAPGNGFVPNPNADDVSLVGHLNSIPVYRMHRHVSGARVRTQETLSLALGRFGANDPPVIVLVAHDKHFERAYRDLRSMYPNTVVNPGIRNVPYRNRNLLRPIEWAFRELVIARPLEFVQRTLFPCHPDLTLPSIPPLPGAGGGVGGVPPVEGQQ